MLEFLSAVLPDDRLKRATAIFVKQTSISEVSKKIAQSIDESLSKQQKEFFLRQQLAAIQRELRNLHRALPRAGTPEPAESKGTGTPASELDDEDQAEQEEMADIRAKIEAMAKDSEERKMAVREWRRLKRTPQTSVEHGVIRNYVRVLRLLHVFRLIHRASHILYSSNGSLLCPGQRPRGPLRRAWLWLPCATGTSSPMPVRSSTRTIMAWTRSRSA